MEGAPDFIPLFDDSPDPDNIPGDAPPEPTPATAREEPAAPIEPPVPDYGAQFRPAAETVTRTVPEDERSRVEAQISLLLRQVEQLRALLVKQKDLTGEFPPLAAPAAGQPEENGSDANGRTKEEAPGKLTSPHA